MAIGMTMIDTKDETRHGNGAIETDPSWSLARRAKLRWILKVALGFPRRVWAHRH